jgi:3,4-dihydroxy 2-butanone 4-phosphate synthase
MQINLHVGEFIKIIENAISDLRSGKFVLIHDASDREGETDLVMSSEFVKPKSIEIMRKDGGGLIFIMISKELADRFKLPFLTDLYSKIDDNYPVLKSLAANDIPYDTKSSFSLYINHRNTFTGITDNDRSLTMNKFANLVKKILDNYELNAMEMLGKEFRSPGHVPICIASKNPLIDRFGHTELVVALLKIANLIPVGSGCEIMGDNGKALSKSEAKKYANKNNLTFLDGRDIIKAWKKWLK